MNDLNSVLIEGTIAGAVERGIDDPKTAAFTIVSKSYRKNAGNIVEELEYIDIKAAGKLAASFVEQGREGRRLRIVGKLRRPGDKPAWIEAEHLEFCKDLIPPVEDSP